MSSIPMTCDRSRLELLARRYAAETGLVASGGDLTALTTALIRFGQLMYFEGSKDVYGLMTECVRVTEGDAPPGPYGEATDVEVHLPGCAWPMKGICSCAVDDPVAERTENVERVPCDVGPSRVSELT